MIAFVLESARARAHATNSVISLRHELVFILVTTRRKKITTPRLTEKPAAKNIVSQLLSIPDLFPERMLWRKRWLKRIPPN